MFPFVSGSLNEFLQSHGRRCLRLSFVLNVNQPPADSAALSGFVFLNSAPKLLLIPYAGVLEKRKSPAERQTALPNYNTERQTDGYS